jgi:hypothetical protein
MKRGEPSDLDAGDLAVDDGEVIVREIGHEGIQHLLDAEAPLEPGVVDVVLDDGCS